MKIDIAAHIVPEKLQRAAIEKTQGRVRWPPLPVLTSLEARFRVMEAYPEVVQVLSMTNAREKKAPPKVVYELARIANEEMAELVTKYSDKFVAALAIIPLTSVDLALREVDRAIKELGCKGIMINAVAERPLDQPEFMTIYERMAQYDLPICIHPQGDDTRPDYPGESVSKYQIWGLWGWPYQTTLAMTRLIFSGVFDRFPTIKFITHHAGAMVPFNQYRVHNWYDPSAQRKEPFMDQLKKHPLDYYRMFYNDVANAGTTAGLMCAYEFFDANHLLFGSDIPWGMPSGYGDTLYKNTIEYVERMEISAEEKAKIFSENARKLFHLQ